MDENPFNEEVDLGEDDFGDDGDYQDASDFVTVEPNEEVKQEIQEKVTEEVEFVDYDNPLEYSEENIGDGDGDYKCSVCGALFEEATSLVAHKQKHNFVKELKDCSYCGRLFKTASQLKSHLRTHTGERPFKCDLCDKSYKQKQQLHYHEMNEHWEASKTVEPAFPTMQKPHACKICMKSFKDISALTTHMRVHTKEKPYKCNICGKTFSQNGILKTHKVVHMARKPFECTECDKSFGTKQQLQVHFRLHTGEKPFKCEHCEERFTHRQSMLTHSRKHLVGQLPNPAQYLEMEMQMKREIGD